MSKEYERQMSADWGSPRRRGQIWRTLRLDPTLLAIIAVIASFGLVVLYSAGDRNQALLEAQAWRLGLGLCIMIIVAQFPPHFFMRLGPWVYLLGLVSLVLIYPFGYEVNGVKALAENSGPVPVSALGTDEALFADCACLVFARAKSAAKAAACFGLAYFAGHTLRINRDSTRPWNLHHHCRVWGAGASFSWTVVAVGRLVKPSVDGFSPRALVSDQGLSEGAHPDVIRS